MKMTNLESTCAVGAVLGEGRRLCGLSVKEFCREAGISMHSYYRLIRKKRPNR